MFSFLIPVLDAIKVVMASIASVVLLGFACVTLAGSAMALIVCTPIFLTFSPILVPAAIATTFLATGLGAGLTLGVTSLGLLMRLIKNPGGVMPSFLSLLEMPNFISLPGFGKKSKKKDKKRKSKNKKRRKANEKSSEKSKEKRRKSKRKGKSGLFGLGKKKDKDEE